MKRTWPGEKLTWETRGTDKQGTYWYTSGLLSEYQLVHNEYTDSWHALYQNEGLFQVFAVTRTMQAARQACERKDEGDSTDD